MPKGLGPAAAAQPRLWRLAAWTESSGSTSWVVIDAAAVEYQEPTPSSMGRALDVSPVFGHSLAPLGLPKPDLSANRVPWKVGTWFGFLYFLSSGPLAKGGYLQTGAGGLWPGTLGSMRKEGNCNKERAKTSDQIQLDSWAKCSAGPLQLVLRSFEAAAGRPMGSARQQGQKPAAPAQQLAAASCPRAPLPVSKAWINWRGDRH